VKDTLLKRLADVKYLKLGENLCCGSVCPPGFPVRMNSTLNDTMRPSDVGNLMENLGNYVINFIFANTFTPNYSV
jgi:hypothetical protein